MSKAFTLVYGVERIPYAVTLDPKRTTRIAIHVDPDGSVLVDAPPDFADDAVRRAVQKRARWVIEHVADARNRHAHVRPREYVSGEQVLYLGRRYMLKVIRVDAPPGVVRLNGAQLEVKTRTGDPDDIRGRVRAWYRIKARNYFAKQLAELAARMSWVDETPPFRMLDMTRQWGSCSPDGYVILNPGLIRAPRECIEYVLIHELSHLRHHDHGPEFWRLLARHVPDWQARKVRLDTMVEVLLRD
jgi:hypothetical protein